MIRHHLYNQPDLMTPAHGDDANFMQRWNHIRDGTDRQMLLVHLSLLATTVIWGLNFVAMKYLIGQVGALHVVLIRVYFAAIVFAGFLLLWRSEIPRFPLRVWGVICFLGVMGSVVNQLLVTFGTSYLSAAVASMIATSTPIFMAILSKIMLSEPLTVRKMTGIGVAFIGFMIVLLYGSGTAEFSVSNSVGVFLTAMAPLSWSLSTIVSRPVMLQYPPKVITGISMIIGGIALLPALVSQRSIFGEIAAFDVTSWAAAFVLSVLAMVVAYTFWYQGLRRLQPTQIAIYVYLVPVFGVIFAWMLLGETITIFLLLGGMTILSGVIITNSDQRPPAVEPGVVRQSEEQSPYTPASSTALTRKGQLPGE